MFKFKGYMITVGDFNQPTGHFGSFPAVVKAHEYLIANGWEPDYPTHTPELSRGYHNKRDGRVARIQKRPLVHTINELNNKRT